MVMPLIFFQYPIPKPLILEEQFQFCKNMSNVVLRHINRSLFKNSYEIQRFIWPLGPINCI